MSAVAKESVKVLCASYAMNFVSDEIFIQKLYELLNGLNTVAKLQQIKFILNEEDKQKFTTLQSAFEMKFITEEIYFSKLSFEFIQPFFEQVEIVPHRKRPRNIELYDNYLPVNPPIVTENIPIIPIVPELPPTLSPKEILIRRVIYKQLTGNEYHMSVEESQAVSSFMNVNGKYQDLHTNKVPQKTLNSVKAIGIVASVGYIMRPDTGLKDKIIHIFQIYENISGTESNNNDTKIHPFSHNGIHFVHVEHTKFNLLFLSSEHSFCSITSSDIGCELYSDIFTRIGPKFDFGIENFVHAHQVENFTGWLRVIQPVYLKACGY
jgi:hypothetical protein